MKKTKESKTQNVEASNVTTAIATFLLLLGLKFLLGFSFVACTVNLIGFISLFFPRLLILGF